MQDFSTHFVVQKAIAVRIIVLRFCFLKKLVMCTFARIAATVVT